MGLLQNEDFKTEAELITAGGAKTQLLNDTKVYMTGLSQTLDDAVSMGLIGGGGATGLITGDNNIPKTTIGSWLAYKNTVASATPETMTGGSPNGTITRNTTAPISDVADFLYTKNGGASRQGEGISLTLTSIPNKYKSRACIFRFKYFTSSTYVDNAVGLFVYDITGAVVYQLNPLYLKKSGLIESSFAEIQLPNTLTSGFRIGFHVIGTDTTAYTINFSEFTFDEKVTSQNSSQTDTYDAIPSALPANATREWAKYRRDGEGIWFDICFAYTGAGSLGLNYNQILPAGHAIDTNKLKFNSSSGISAGLGGVAIFDSGVDNYVAQFEYQSGSIYLRGIGGLGIAIASGDRLTLKGYLPILGWSAGTQIADIYTGRTIAAAWTTSTSVANNSGVYLDIDASVYDKVGMLTLGAGVNGKVTIPTDGIYHIDYHVSSPVDSTQGERAFLYLYKNGVEEIGGWDGFEANSASDGSATVSLKGSATREYKAGDIVQVLILQTFGATYTFSGEASIYRIAGENQPLASEKVVEAWESNAGTSYVNGANLILEDKVLATHGAYNPSTGEFIANKAGILTINGVFGSSNTNTATEIYIYTRKNGADHRVISDLHAPIASKSYIKYGDSYPVNQGDSIFIRVAHNGSSMATAAFTFYNHVTFNLE